MGKDAPSTYASLDGAWQLPQLSRGTMSIPLGTAPSLQVALTSSLCTEQLDGDPAVGLCCPLMECLGAFIILTSATKKPQEDSDSRGVIEA
jgi:hypothetical protein